MTIHQRLIELRRETQLSIRELAKEIDVPHSNYQRVEHSQAPDFLMLSKLSIHYGLTLSGLLRDVAPIT